MSRGQRLLGEDVEAGRDLASSEAFRQRRLVDEAAARRGKGAERHADAHADTDRDQRNGDRIAGADHDHRQDVAAEMVGAEPVRRRGRLRPVGDHQPGYVVGCPDEGDERSGHDQQRDDKPDQEGAVAEGLGEHGG
jgi:hypothetical protein